MTTISDPALLQLVAHCKDVNKLINKELSAIEYDFTPTLNKIDDFEYMINIKNSGKKLDLYKPTKLYCYNVKNNFKVTGISLYINNIEAIDITDLDFFNFIDFIEDNKIDDKLHKIYHLDKLNLFLDIPTLNTLIQQILIKVKINGICDEIKIGGECTYFDTIGHKMIANQDQFNIKQFAMSNEVIYNNKQEIISLLYGGLSHCINGVIIKGLDYKRVKSIKWLLNGLQRLYYSDKLLVKSNIKILVDDNVNNNYAFYIPLNNCNYYDDFSNKGLISHRIDKQSFIFELDDDYKDVKIKIGAYSNNIILMNPNNYNTFKLLLSDYYTISNNFNIKVS
jgi:hypothetical protein